MVWLKGLVGTAANCCGKKLSKRHPHIQTLDSKDCKKREVCVYLLDVSHLFKVKDNKRLLIVVGRSYQRVLILNRHRLLDRYLVKTAFLDS